MDQAIVINTKGMNLDLRFASNLLAKASHVRRLTLHTAGESATCEAIMCNYPYENFFIISQVS